VKIIDIVKSLLPDGTNGSEFWEDSKSYRPVHNDVLRCPIWPPDIFAVLGVLIERSSCYTEAGPNRDDPCSHKAYLEEIAAVVMQWSGDERYLFEVPTRVQSLWTIVVNTHGAIDITEVMERQNEELVNRDLVSALLLLFALADEVCRGMGWDYRAETNVFAALALGSFVNQASVSLGVPLLPYSPNSLCALVPPSAAIVMPKTLTATVGCTIRSLSHHLALLPPLNQCRPTWALTNEPEDDSAYKPIRLLVIPFPFSLPAGSFRTTDDPVHLSNGIFTAAYFGLEQEWLQIAKGKPLTAVLLFQHLVEPLLQLAAGRDTAAVTGVVMPECALSETIANELAKLMGSAGVSFFTTGILLPDPGKGKTRNVAKTYVLHEQNSPHQLEQFKHHRWRLDRAQCEQYGLDFHRLSRAEKWWEDIDVSNRQLPFFALRRYMSMTVLICEDLARNDPAMAVVRAVGPNLVIALLMDGPQLNHRWPGKYATVLGEDPGSGVLSVTCAAMVDRSNNNRAGETKRIIGLWRSEGSAGTEISLPDGHHAVLLDIHSRLVEQHTLDTRPDAFDSRKLSLHRQTPLKLESLPKWL
jgi:hypothetical protein